MTGIVCTVGGTVMRIYAIGAVRSEEIYVRDLEYCRNNGQTSKDLPLLSICDVLGALNFASLKHAAPCKDPSQFRFLILKFDGAQ